MLKLYATYCNLLQHAHKSSLLCGMLRPLTYNNAVCERCRIHHGLLQHRRTSKYGAQGLTCLRLETGL